MPKRLQQCDRLAAFKVPRYITFAKALRRVNTSNKVLKCELMNVSDPLANTYDGETKRWRRACCGHIDRSLALDRRCPSQ